MPTTIRTLAKLSTWLIAPLFCLWIHWDSLFTWYQADEFAFLGLHRDVFGWNSFWKVILTPSPQGTFRPLSERTFFLLIWRWFGLDALPYHAAVLMAEGASLLLLYWMVLRLTRSRVAAVLAPVLWTANAALADVMAYNEIFCGLFLLAALALWMKFEETGKWRYYVLQFIVFVLGFAVLELNIVFPAIAAAWAILQGRFRLALFTMPLFAVSLAFYVFHARIAPAQTAGPYAMHFDSAIIATLWTYWKWTFVTYFWNSLPGYSPVLAALVIGLLSGAVLIFVVDESRRRNFQPLFFVVFFLATLAPLLPLRDHHSAYYLALPSVGIATVLAMLAARYRLALSVAAIYLVAAIPAARAGARDNLQRGQDVRNLVLGVKHAIEAHPGKTILLTDVSADLYGSAIVHHPFRVFTDTAVYLAPEMLAQSGVIDRDWPSVATFALQPGPSLQALKNDRLEVYSAAHGRLRNITSVYIQNALATLSPGAPLHVNVGDELEAYLLGPGWYPREGTYRWMSRRASVQMSGTTGAHKKLVLSGYCVEQLIHSGPATISIYIDGEKLPTEQKLMRVETFEREFALPASAAGKPSITVEIEVNPTFSNAINNRELSLVFGTLEIR